MPRYTFHDATTGEFVSENYATEHPSSTVRIEANSNLGVATTQELIDELHARVHVAATVGETWPNYSTAGSE